MVEIIEPGTKNRTSCKFCGAILAYTKEDVKESEKFFGPNISHFEKYIICPQCQYRIVLEATK